MIALSATSEPIAQEDEGLLVQLDERRAGRPPTSAAVAAQWFAQDLFEGAEDEDEDEDEGEQADASRKQRVKRAKLPAGAAQHVCRAHLLPRRHIGGVVWLEGHGAGERAADGVQD